MQPPTTTTTTFFLVLHNNNPPSHPESTSLLRTGRAAFLTLASSLRYLTCSTPRPPPHFLEISKPDLNMMNRRRSVSVSPSLSPVPPVASHARNPLSSSPAEGSQLSALARSSFTCVRPPRMDRSQVTAKLSGT